jgi:hypothetical protein
LVVAVPLAILAAITLFRIHSDALGLVLADEGFLWYGAQRILAGEVPLRDFQAYEPGRYYWTAFWMWLAHDDGILLTRWAAAGFEAIAIGILATEVRRHARSVAVAILVSVGCILLMTRWHTRYEPSIALLQAVVLATVVQKPTGRRLFAGGLQAGLAAVFGRNLALYGFVGLLGVLAVAWWCSDDRRSLARSAPLAAAGVVVGALPLLGMLLLVPGFATAFWQSILRMFELGATNIPLPVPWPWTMPYARLSWPMAVGAFLSGLCFIAPPALALGAAAWVLRRGRRALVEHPLFTAATILAIPYMHYIFSRADMEHFSRGGAPLMLALALAPVKHTRLRVAPAVAVVAALALLPAFSPVGWPQERKACRETTIGHTPLCVLGSSADLVEGARAMVERFVGPGESAFFAPHFPGLYSALNLKAPSWEIYGLLPVGRRIDEAEIERLERARTRLGIISMFELDGRPELRYDVTHPLTFGYLEQRFAIVQQPALRPPLFVLVRP